jgi:DNA-binding Lrp family transcriptional regulator
LRVIESPARLDPLDLRIIGCLREDGRTSNRDLARRLGVAEGTVRSRIRRLADANIMHVQAVPDMAAAGVEFLLLLWIKVEGRPVRDVALDIGALPWAHGLSIVSGVYDIFVTVAARSKEELYRILSTDIPEIEGILEIDQVIALDILTYRSEWGPFVE